MSAPPLLYVGTFLSKAGANRSYCEDLADRLEMRGRHVVRTSQRLPRLSRVADMLRVAWRERGSYRAAIVDVFSGMAFVWAEAVCFELARLGKPFVLTLHGGNLPEFAAKWPRRVRHLLGSAAAVTAPSSFLAERMRAFREDLRVVRNAIDIDSYPFAPRDRARSRLVWVRAFHEMYDPVLAVDVLARVAARHPDVRLAMIGPDKDGSRARVESRARQLGVLDRLDLPGAVSRVEVADRLGAADVFVNTTRVDNTPLSVIEAMASGLCVVSTSVGGIPHLVRDGETGILVPPGDAAAMADGIDRVLREPALAARLSRGARAFATECDWAPVLAQWDALLDGVAARD